MMLNYLPTEVLKGFDNYRYNSKDTSPFSNYVMHPFWNSFTKCLPMWLPPNAITFAGFLLLPINFIVLSYYDINFKAHGSGVGVPSWVWLMCAFNNFMSHTLDGADGKQARRTGTSSALGELFDHGLDAWSTTFFAIAVYDVFGQGAWGVPPFRFLLVLISLQTTFVFSHWEKYNTGVLFLPWGYDPAIMGMTLIYLLTWLCGVEIWEYTIKLQDQQVTVANCLECFLHVANIGISTPICIFNVLYSRYRRSGRMLSLADSLRPLMPIAIFFSTLLLWAANSSTGVLEAHPRCFYTLAGIIFANITSRLIVSQMSETPASWFNSLLAPLIVLAGLSCYYNLGNLEDYMLYCFTLCALIMHVHYGYHVVLEMANYLNIYTFSVKKPSPSRSKDQFLKKRS